MSRFARTASAAALILALAAPAMAQVSYPRSVGSGENSEIDYGPGGNTSAPLGGGRFEVVGRNSEGQAELRYLDPQYAQPARAGLVPLTVGSGEGSATVWVPAGTDRSRLALIGADGSLPAEKGRGSSFLAGIFARLLGPG
jgi:hypothetical protein